MRKGKESLPQGLIKRIAYLPNGKERSEKKVAWLYRYLETGDGTQSVIDAGFESAHPAKTSWGLVNELYPLIQEAAKYRQAMVEPLAWRFLEKTLRVCLDEAGGEKPDPRVLGIGVKAAGEVLDRGGMPKGLALKGLGDSGGNDESEGSWQDMLAGFIASVGVDAVRKMDWIMDRKEYREYIEAHYGSLRVVNE